MLFGIFQSMSCNPKFWHVYVITYMDFMAIVKPYHYQRRETGIPGNLEVKSKLPPRSGSTLEAVQPHGAIKRP